VDCKEMKRTFFYMQKDEMRSRKDKEHENK